MLDADCEKVGCETRNSELGKVERDAFRVPRSDQGEKVTFTTSVQSPLGLPSSQKRTNSTSAQQASKTQPRQITSPSLAPRPSLRVPPPPTTAAP